MRAAILGMMLLMATPLAAQEGPMIEGFGRSFAVEEAELKPDPSLRYRVVFDVMGAARDAKEPHQGFERVARMANLLSTNGVKVMPGDLVITVHGPAVRALLTDAAHAKRNDGAANVSAGLVKALIAAGIEVRLCGQSARALGVTREDLLPGVHIDTAAITTMATLQLKGYAIIQD